MLWCPKITCVMKFSLKIFIHMLYLTDIEFVEPVEKLYRHILWSTATMEWNGMEQNRIE